jgi:2-keto-4-pentenoate hydratase/2-oxohepta-3-ene-1,7-dioic acid hydratase in catechol pathway
VAPLRVWGYAAVLELVEAGPRAWARVEAEAAEAPSGWNLPDLPLMAPIPRPPRNMMCVGVNYQTHFDEGKRPEGTKLPEAPVLFTKPWTSLCGHDAEVTVDRSVTERADWEAELAVVIGLPGRNIAAADAEPHVFGYTLANDLSARDLQLAHGQFGQWFKGKSLDGFCPMGPWIVTRSELPDPDVIELELTVNGDRKQKFSAAGMVNPIPRIIQRASLGMRLLPGDVILTGTSSGVGHWRQPPEFLGEGDVVAIHSPQIGVLQTRIREQARA